MLIARNYVFAVMFGLIAGVAAYLLLSNNTTPAGTVLLESIVVGVVGAGGYLYGQYNRARQNQNKSNTKVSKNQQKRMRKRM